MASEVTSSSTIRFGAFELDLRAGELRKQGVRLPIQGQPLQVLAVLLENPGQVVSREELRRRLWPADTFVDFVHSLHNDVARVREALGDSSEKPRFIETLPRRGYRFIAPVENGRVEDSPQVASATQPAPSWPRRRLLLTSVLLMAAAVALGSAWLFFRFYRAPSNPQIVSIAVLPLENLSGDPAQDYFGDGMTDELITELAQISSLRVISRTSAMHYRRTGQTVPEIARELNVDAVLEGSVVRSGNRVRINAQLIEARDDKHLWARSYEADAQDVLGMQQAVARDVVKQIRLRLTAREQERLGRSRPVNPEAHEAFLKGLYYWNKRNRAALEQAIEFFHQAIAIDPNYAQAYAGLANSYLPLCYYGYLPGSEAQGKVMAALKRALELDDSLAEAHTALGSAKSFFEYDWPGAEKEFLRAIELNPNYATGHQWYAQTLNAEGRGEEAIAENRRAMELDPLSLIIHEGIGVRLYRLRRYDEAVVSLDQTLQLDPSFPATHLDLGLLYGQQKNFPAAITELKKANDLFQGNLIVLGALGYAYGASGDKAQGNSVLRQLELLREKQYVPSYPVALVYLGLGEKDRAFAWLEKAIADRDPLVTFLNADPVFDGLRPDPRFADLLRRMRLAE